MNDNTGFDDVSLGVADGNRVARNGVPIPIASGGPKNKSYLLAKVKFCLMMDCC